MTSCTISMIISNEDVLHSIRCNSVSVWANLNASPSPGVHYDCSVPAESMYHWQLRMLAVLLLAAATAGSLATSVWLRDVKGQLGEPLHLNCSDGHPTPGVWWEHKGHNVSSTPQLEMPALTCQELGTYLCVDNSNILKVVEVEVEDAQCTGNGGLFVPLVAALSFVVALWLCCTLCLIGGLCKVRSKRQCNCRGHGNQLQQANIPEEGLSVPPCPQEDRPCPSVVIEPLPSPPPPSPPPDLPPQEDVFYTDEDSIGLDLLGYVKIDPAKPTHNQDWLWVRPDTRDHITAPPRRRGSTLSHSEGGILSQAALLDNQMSASLPTTPAVGTHILGPITEESAMQYMPDMPARTGRFLYTTRQQYETMTSTTFKTHDMKEEEHAPGTDTVAKRHHYQNVADWWSTDDSLTVAMDSQEQPHSSHGNISESHLSCDTPPPAAPSSGHHGSKPELLLYENVHFSEGNN